MQREKKIWKLIVWDYWIPKWFDIPIFMVKNGNRGFSHRNRIFQKKQTRESKKNSISKDKCLPKDRERDAQTSTDIKYCLFFSNLLSHIECRCPCPLQPKKKKMWKMLYVKHLKFSIYIQAHWQFFVFCTYCAHPFWIISRGNGRRAFRDIITFLFTFSFGLTWPIWDEIE